MRGDKTYQFELTSRDVLHSFSVPVFRLKQDAIPGRIIKGWFKPDARRAVRHSVHGDLRHRPRPDAGAHLRGGPRGSTRRGVKANSPAAAAAPAAPAPAPEACHERRRRTPRHGHGHEHHDEPGFFKKYFWSTDHKMIGMQYLFTGMSMALIGGFTVYVFRMQLAFPGMRGAGLRAA